MDFALLWQHCVTDIPDTNILSVCLDRTPPDSLEFKALIPELRKRKLIFQTSIAMRYRLEKLGLYPLISDSEYQFNYAFLSQALAKIECYDYLLNPDAFIAPFGVISVHPYAPDPMFLRPNSGCKVFPGQVVKKSNLPSLHLLYKLSLDELCVASPVMDIQDETRCFVMPYSDNPLLACTRYFHKDTPLDARGEISPHDIKPFLAKLKDYPCWPDAMVIDFCRLRISGAIKIIEMNSIHTSGLYEAKGMITELITRLE